MIYLQSIENKKFKMYEIEFNIIEVVVRGNLEQREQLLSDIQQWFSLAHDEWQESHAMLTMTFDYIPKEQTMTMIKRWIKDYIENLKNT